MNTLDWNNGTSTTVYLKDISFPVKLLKKVFTNEDGSTGILYLISNDLSIDADRMYEVYQKRWRKVKTSLNHFAIKQKLLLKANQIMFKELQLLKASA